MISWASSGVTVSLSSPTLLIQSSIFAVGFNTSTERLTSFMSSSPFRARTRTPVRRTTPNPCCNHQSMMAASAPDGQQTRQLLLKAPEKTR